MPAPPSHSNSFLGKVKQSFVALYETLVATLQIAGKRMERWNIGIDLPKMYRPLGREIHSSGRFRNEFPDVFSALDSHQKELDALERGEASVPDGDHSEEAKQAAAKRKEEAARSISGKMNTEYERLGQLAWEKHGEASGPAALLAPIRQARQRQETLTAEIESIRASFASRRLTPKRLVFGAAGCLVIFVLLLPQAIRDARETQRRHEAERLAAAEVDAPQQQTEETEKASGSLARYTMSQQEAIASDPRLRIAHDMGHLDSAKLGNYLRVKSEMQRKGLDVESGTGINFLFLTLIPSEDWPTAARRLGLSREEYRHATNMAMGTAGVALHEFDSERDRLTGESLDEYAKGGESIRRSNVATTDAFLEQLRQITGGRYIDMRGPFREGISTEYGVLMGHPPSNPSNAVDSTTLVGALGEPDLIQQESGSFHHQRWSYRLTDGVVTFRVSNYDVLRDRGLQPDGGILVDGSSIKVVIE